jgi:hypothetical protein
MERLSSSEKFIRVFREGGTIIPLKHEVVTYEPVSNGARQPEALVICVSDPNREPAPIKARLEIEDAEHFHAISRYRELLPYDADLAVTQGFYQTVHDREVRNRNMRCCCGWRWHTCQLHPCNFAVARD